MKAIILRDLFNTTQAVFCPLDEDINSDKIDIIRDAAKNAGFLVVIREISFACTVNDIVQEITRMGEVV